MFVVSWKPTKCVSGSLFIWGQLQSRTKAVNQITQTKADVFPGLHLASLGLAGHCAVILGVSWSAWVMLTGISGDMFCNQDETLGKDSSKRNRKLALLKISAV